MDKLTVKSLPEDMASLPVDFTEPNRTLLHGCFWERANIAGKERKFLTYIPKDLEYCQPCLVVAPPSGHDPLTYLEASGLRALADQERLFLFLLVPEKGGWQTDGGDADYMNTVYMAIQRRDFYVTMQDNIYACGIGDGAVIAHQAAQRMTSEWSGLFSFGALTRNLLETRDARVASQEQNGSELRIAAVKCQLPVWLAVTSMDEHTAAAVNYWKAENHAAEPPLSGQGADLIWMPSPVRRYSEVNEEQIAQVRVTLGNEDVSLESLRRMWGYIGLARRHRGYGQKNLRYFKRPSDLGAVLQQREIGGMDRLWYEYVPESCTPDRKWPLVVAMHGRGGTAETFFDLTNLFQVAEARKFITVFPQAGIHQQKLGGLKNVLYWNGIYEGTPIDDVAFIRAMVADVESRLPIDQGRIYACGQSSGGIMADVLSTCASDLFTACASWSGMYHPKKVHGTYPRTAPVIPTLFLCGAEDAFCTERGEDPELPFRLIPELRRDIMEKLERCQLDIKRIQTWTTDPITWYCWPDEQGVPMLSVGIVRDMPHANYPEESWISYDQFFSGFYRNEKSQLCWRGKIIESIQDTGKA